MSIFTKGLPTQLQEPMFPEQFAKNETEDIPSTRPTDTSLKDHLEVLCMSINSEEAILSHSQSLSPGYRKQADLSSNWLCYLLVMPLAKFVNLILQMPNTDRKVWLREQTFWHITDTVAAV